MYQLHIILGGTIIVYALYRVNAHSKPACYVWLCLRPACQSFVFSYTVLSFAVACRCFWLLTTCRKAKALPACYVCLLVCSFVCSSVPTRTNWALALLAQQRCPTYCWRPGLTASAIQAALALTTTVIKNFYYNLISMTLLGHCVVGWSYLHSVQ